MTTEAPLSLARSEGRGSKASGSAAGGTMVSTCARSPATARARLPRSVVVATMRRPCADAVGDAKAIAIRLATMARRGADRRRAALVVVRRSLPLGNEHAL